MSRYLEMIDGPAHVKKLTLEQLQSLAQEIRQELIDGLAKGGGHLGPNLGVVELTIALATEMLAGAGITDVDVAAALKDGRAMDKWRAMISAQGGDNGAPLPVARESDIVYAQADGVVTSLDAMDVGVAAWRLGAGRARRQDPVQAGAGVRLHAKPGDLVRRGQPLATMLTDTPERFERARESLEKAATIAPAGSRPDMALIHERITAS